MAVSATNNVSCASTLIHNGQRDRSLDMSSDAPRISAAAPDSTAEWISVSCTEAVPMTLPQAGI
jgi:hypothetical protein